MLATSVMSLLPEIGVQIVTAVILITVGILWGRWRAIVAWRKKEFKDRVLLSLNCIEKKDDKLVLKLRTLFERNIHDVLQNDMMENIVNGAISDVHENDPILRLPPEDAWYVLNAILNRMSELFAAGFLRQEMGLAPGCKRYTFCLTFEKEGGIRIQKLRVMLIEKEKLLNFPENAQWVLESDKHKFRLQTLSFLKKELQKNPHLFMDIELCV